MVRECVVRGYDHECTLFEGTIPYFGEFTEHSHTPTLFFVLSFTLTLVLSLFEILRIQSF